MMFVIITTTVQFCSQTMRQKSLMVLAMGPAKQEPRARGKRQANAGNAGQFSYSRIFSILLIQLVGRISSNIWTSSDKIRRN